MRAVHELLEQAKNVVFDVGKVLLRFEPEEILARMLSGRAARMLTASALFESEAWSRLDEGTMSEEAVARSAARGAGDETLWPEALRVIEHYQEYMQPLPTCEWIPRLHAQGKKVYVLSNYGVQTFARAERRFAEIFRQMDGMVISGREKLLKPDPRIYALLLSRYALTAGECVFVDDRLENVQGARRAGMQAIHFTGAEALW